MISMIVILVVAIGAVSYMYASMSNAKEADVRAGAARLALLLLQSWKANGANVSTYNPANPVENINLPPLSDFATPGALNLNTASGFNLLQCYRIQVDNVKYFVEMTYDNSTPAKLCVYVAWNKSNYASTTLSANRNLVSLADFAYMY